MKLQELAEEIRTIKDNHLKHMAEDLDRVEKKVEEIDGRIWAILIMLLAAVVIPAVIKFVETYALN